MSHGLKLLKSKYLMQLETADGEGSAVVDQEDCAVIESGGELFITLGDIDAGIEGLEPFTTFRLVKVTEQPELVNTSFTDADGNDMDEEFALEEGIGLDDEGDDDVDGVDDDGTDNGIDDDGVEGDDDDTDDTGTDDDDQ